MEKRSKFTPLYFLASLGAGGVAIMPFVFFQYTHHTGKGLITYQQMGHGTLGMGKEILFHSLESVMIVFALLHVVLTLKLIGGLFQWIRSQDYSKFINEPLSNAGVLAPFISLGMTFNIVIGVVRFFVPALSENFQALMLPALLFWAVMWGALMRMEIKLLKISFTHSYDVNKINFGWLLHPFALGMITVVGTGIAAMSKTPWIAHTAAFLSLISLTMGLFLLVVKLIAIFKSHFSAPGLPEKQFLPSFLIVVPNITLFAISAFRLSHYLEHQFNYHLHAFAVGVVILAFAFQTWYMMFGLSLLKDYFRKHFFNQEFHVSQWGLICPLVAYAVMAAFFHKLFVPNAVLYAGILAVIGITVGAYLLLLYKNLKCIAATRRNENHDCATSLLPQTQ